ncbi:MAG TPA: sorbitol dehydrogenase [Thermoanaerobaculia bacterium]|nr:sorbitol dehydrogenase [Thermoanaerobaculia bacterium]
MTTTPSTGGPSESVVQDFANMSAALTGFQPSFIRPFLDPVNLSGTFYEFAVSQAGQPMMDALLNAFRAIQTQPPQTIANTLLEITPPPPPGQGPSNQAQLCQSIIAMWYLGSWYPPPFLAGSSLQQVISAQAYTKSLVWNVAQAHPMGFSAFTFGYWSQPPASLSTFGVNTGNGGGQ